MNERNTHNYDSESNSSGWIVGTLTGSKRSSRYFAHCEFLDFLTSNHILTPRWTRRVSATFSAVTLDVFSLYPNEKSSFLLFPSSAGRSVDILNPVFLSFPHSFMIIDRSKPSRLTKIGSTTFFRYVQLQRLRTLSGSGRLDFIEIR